MRHLIVALLASHLLWSSVARAELAAVWALDDGTKIKADATSHPLKAKNGVFDGTSIKIFGARNETVAFQVILQGGAAATSNVSARLRNIGTIANGAVSDDPDTYYLNRNLEIFQQRYLEVKERSKGLLWEVNNVNWPEVPKDLLGPVPDPLVPLGVAGQLTVAAGRNQGLWVDVYVPKSTEVGVHQGTFEVLVDGQPCALPACSLPVELTVINATIPDQAPVKTMLYFSGHDADSCLKRYLQKPNADDPTQIQARHFKLFRRHLVSGFIGADTQPNDFLRRRLDGSLFTPAEGYSGWGEGVGQDLYSVDTYGDNKISHDKALVWSEWLKTNAPQADTFAYAWDEPAKGAYDNVNARAAELDPLPAFVTVDYTPDLDQVDIFCTYAENYKASVWQAGVKAGKTMWIYNGTRPFTGTFGVDDTAVSPRVNPWIQYKYDLGRWFYWESTYYRDYQGGGGDTRLFSNPMTFTGAGRVNGDGVLVYPGRDRVHADEDLGFDHPLPSVRLKNWRRGIQDVAYLRFAKAAGHDAEHDAALAALIPKVLDQTTWDQAVSWPDDDGEQWLEQRRRLAMLFVNSAAPTFPAGSEAKDPTTPGPVLTQGDGASPAAIDDLSLRGGCAVGRARSTGAPAAALPLLLVLLGLALWARSRQVSGHPGSSRHDSWRDRGR